MPTENVLTVPCDVLIPAAIGGVITGDNAADLQCKVCSGPFRARFCCEGAVGWHGMGLRGQPASGSRSS
jgi:glutamate dehydrogenase/leucine dehydrogenase